MSTVSPAVLITGATGKLGRIFALGFAGLGFNVVFTSRGGAVARELERDCLMHGAKRVMCLQVDLTVDNISFVIAEELKKVELLPDILINNARNAQYLNPAPNGRTTRENWQGELLLGVMLPYELTMTLADQMPTPLKTVINIASIYGVSAPNLSLYDRPELQSSVNYGVTKAALIHLTKELAVRLAPRNISVNAVSYGGVSGRVNDDFQERYSRLCPAGRMLNESDVFGAVKFLASSDAAGMVGHNLVVDGGWTIW
ncbi:MAG: SDR family oxidoreductase [Proteobacteria bacterium]|nr:SDR family oxidoreductase [Pseudomonadota bacterium]